MLDASFLNMCFFFLYFFSRVLPRSIVCRSLIRTHISKHNPLDCPYKLTLFRVFVVHTLVLFIPSQRNIGTILLPSFKNKYFSSKKLDEGGLVKVVAGGCVCVGSISCVLLCWWTPSHGSSVG